MILLKLRCAGCHRVLREVRDADLPTDPETQAEGCSWFACTKCSGGVGGARFWRRIDRGWTPVHRIPWSDLDPAISRARARGKTENVRVSNSG